MNRVGTKDEALTVGDIRRYLDRPGAQDHDVFVVVDDAGKHHTVTTIGRGCCRFGNKPQLHFMRTNDDVPGYKIG